MTLQAGETPTGLARYVPILSWLPQYQRGWLRIDLVAGLTASAVVIPQAMAYASIAGLPVEVGLYTSFVPMVIVSLLALLYVAGHPPVYVVGRKAGTDVFRPLGDNPQDEVLPGLLMVRMEGLMYYASAPRALERITMLTRQYQPRVLVLDCSAVPTFEYTALKQFNEYEEKLRASGITLWLAALNREALKGVESSPLGKTLSHQRMFFNLEQAMEAYQEMAAVA